MWVKALPAKGSVGNNWSVNTYNETHAGWLPFSLSLILTSLLSQHFYPSVINNLSRKEEIFLFPLLVEK